MHVSKSITLDKRHLLHHHKNNNSLKHLLPLDYKTIQFFATPLTLLSHIDIILIHSIYTLIVLLFALYELFIGWKYLKYHIE